MALPKLSLQALEAFECVAQAGSLQAAARRMGLSIASISHHIARLEDQLGATLLDRRTRPFTLTREGQEALRHLSAGLTHLRQATSETAIGGLRGARSLRIGIVEDFESTVAPDMAVTLARHMPRARLSVEVVLSHAAPDLIAAGSLDAAIAAEADDTDRGQPTQTLMRDPYVAVVPRGCDVSVADLLQGQGGLPFLRFNTDHLIGRQIAAHLARNQIALPERLSFDSVQSIMAVVAAGGGWSIVTRVGHARAQRFAGHVALRPLPIPAFARRIVLMQRPDLDPSLGQAIAALFRQTAQQALVAPAREGQEGAVPPLTFVDGGA